MLHTVQSGVICRFQCEVDPHQSYIGKTKRHLGSRIKKHNKKDQCYIRLLRRLNCNYRCTGANFTVLDSASDDLSLNFSKAVYIFKKI